MFAWFQKNNATSASAAHDFNIPSGTCTGVYKIRRLARAKHKRSLPNTNIEYGSFWRKCSCVLFRCAAVQLLHHPLRVKRLGQDIASTPRAHCPLKQ
jgi:hypothetical protein